LELADRLASAGRENEARHILSEALRSPDLALVCLASVHICKLFREPFAKLMALIRGMGLTVVEAYDLAREVVREANWRDLECYLATRRDQIDSDGTSKTWLGIAQHGSGFISLAYLSYRRAMEEGISVARSNIAPIVSMPRSPARLMSFVLKSKRLSTKRGGSSRSAWIVVSVAARSFRPSSIKPWMSRDHLLTERGSFAARISSKP
jgi:hypothetical protein